MLEIPDQNFERLFRQHYKALCDLACNIVSDPDAAKDVVQEVFVKLWKNRDQVNFGDQIKHYLFKATSHTALNHLRYQKKLIRLENYENYGNMVASSGTEGHGFKELELRIRQAIDKLPPKCKAIYVLSRQEGLKYQEIAETLGLSLKTVENQMGIALEKLREDLKPFLTPEFLVLILLTGLMVTFLLF